MSTAYHEKFEVSLGRLVELERDSKDLKKARSIIRRQRAYIKVLKEELKNRSLEQVSVFVEFMKNRKEYRDRFICMLILRRLGLSYWFNEIKQKNGFKK